MTPKISNENKTVCGVFAVNVTGRCGSIRAETDPARAPRPKQWEPGWKCPECKLIRGENGHDPCLGELPGVMYACCGHGGKTSTKGYVCFENGTVIRFHQLYAVEDSEGKPVVQRR